MSEQMTYYKVVRRVAGGLRSACTRESEFDLEYVPGVTTCPSVGRLFVFETLQDAKRYAMHREVWECTVTGTPTPLWMLDVSAEKEAVWTQGTPESPWEYKPKDCLMLMPCPVGTLLVDTVTLSRRVYSGK